SAPDAAGHQCRAVLVAVALAGAGSCAEGAQLLRVGLPVAGRGLCRVALRPVPDSVVFPGELDLRLAADLARAAQSARGLLEILGPGVSRRAAALFAEAAGGGALAKTAGGA